MKSNYSQLTCPVRCRIERIRLRVKILASIPILANPLRTQKVSFGKVFPGTSRSDLAGDAKIEEDLTDRTKWWQTPLARLPSGWKRSDPPCGSANKAHELFEEMLERGGEGHGEAAVPLKESYQRARARWWLRPCRWRLRAAGVSWNCLSQ